MVITYTDRREFLQRLAMMIGCAASGVARCGRGRLPIGFSTLGCPSWDWLKILDFAQQNGFAAVELRGMQGTMDLPSRPEFGATRLEQTKKEIADRGLRISCVSSSATLHTAGQEQRTAACRCAAVSLTSPRSLPLPTCAFFGNKLIGPRAPALEHIAASLRELGDYAGPKNVAVLLESHGDFTDAPTLREILEAAGSSHVGLLWDAHNTFVDGKEDPAVSVGQLAQIHPAYPSEGLAHGRVPRPITSLPGAAGCRVKRQVELLVAAGYAGYYSFEWEKAWHPEIDEPEVAIADFARVVTDYLQAASPRSKSHS